MGISSPLFRKSFGILRKKAVFYAHNALKSGIKCLIIGSTAIHQLYFGLEAVTCGQDHDLFAGRGQGAMR